jgi:hypothetical protein
MAVMGVMSEHAPHPDDVALFMLRRSPGRGAPGTVRPEAGR